MRRNVAITIALALLASACGSTAQVGRTELRGGVPVGGTEAGGGSFEDELTLGTDVAADEGIWTGDAGFAAPAASGDPLIASGRTSDRSSPSASQDTPGRPGTQGPPATAAQVQGLTDTQMFVGLAYVEDQTESNAALGAAGITGGEGRRYQELWLDYYNSRGGLAGRELVPVWHSYNAAGSEPPTTQNQAACTRYTQDTPVFVSLNGGISGPDNFLACMNEAGIPIITGTGVDDDDTFGQFRRYVTISSLSNDAIARIWPGGLDEGGYFTPRTVAEEVKVGLVTFDIPKYRRPVERSLRPAMRAVGQEFADEIYVRYGSTLSDVGQLATDLGNAILRFRTQGIYHVMLFENGSGVMTLLFLQGAENQGYRPRYGLNSSNGGQVIADIVPSGQLQDAVSVAWNPMFDVPEGDYDDWGPGRAECDQVYADAGITFDSANAHAIGLLNCDNFRALAAAVNAVDGPLTNDGLIDGVGRLGSTWDSGLMGPTRFGPDRRYGISRYRLTTFFSDCTCYRYVSDWYPIP